MATYVDFIFKMEVSSLFDPVGHLVNQAYIFSIFFLKRPHNWKQSRVPMLKSPQSRIIKNVITAPHIALALFAFRI